MESAAQTNVFPLQKTKIYLYLAAFFKKNVFF